jgi:hypothetical protein
MVAALSFAETGSASPGKGSVLFRQIQAPRFLEDHPGDLMGPGLLVLLRLEFGVVVTQERANVVRHIKELQPLLLVESYGKVAQAVQRYAALAADLE